MSTSNDDDEGGSFKPGLESIMEASLLDDCGGRRDLFYRIMEHFRSWNNSRDNDRPLGPSKDIRTIQVAGQEIQTTRTRTIELMSTLSETK